MIAHTPDTITIRQYAKFEKSKDLRLLFRVRVPMWYAVKRSHTFIESFNELFNAKSEDANDKELYKLIARNLIMLMQAVLMGIQLHLSEKIQLELIKSGGKPTSIDDPVLTNYLAEAKECSGIEITSIEDINTFKTELERRIDKYNELYPVKEIEDHKGVSIMQLVFSVESLLNCHFDYDKMTLYEFSEAKKLADERAKQMQETLNKSQNG